MCVPLETADVPGDFMSAQAIAHPWHNKGGKRVHCQAWLLKYMCSLLGLTYRNID